MLNEKGIRELAYVVKIDGIEPIEGKDRVEAAIVGGWKVMVKKGEFRPGDLAVYFEIDSQVPEKEPFLFLAPKHFKIKTQKYGNFYSQGLVMPLAELGLKDVKEGDFLTEKLGVTYATAEDRKRKSNVNKYDKMRNAHPKLFKRPLVKWLFKSAIGKRLLYIFFRPKKDREKYFPNKYPYIKVTDEERVENMPYILEDKSEWVKTTKIDGTSSTYIAERKGRKINFYVYSRHVRQFDPSQKSYHNTETNVYWEMNEKYKIREFLESILTSNPDLEYVCLQGETAGVDLQGNPHKFPDRRFFGFNFIDSKNGRWDTIVAARLCSSFEIPWVPIVDEHYILPDDMEEFKLSADGPCEAPDAQGLREGYVYRNALDPNRSFKNVSRKYLSKQK